METIKCHVCNKFVIILSRIDLPHPLYPYIKEIDDRHYWEIDKMPASLYWNKERKEIYCSPKCGLKRYNEVNNVT